MLLLPTCHTFLFKNNVFCFNFLYLTDFKSDLYKTSRFCLANLYIMNLLFYFYLAWYLKYNPNGKLCYSNRRKILAVTTQLKHLRKESLKKNSGELRMKDQIEERSLQLLRNLSSCEKKACLSCVVTAWIFLLFDLSSAVQIYVSYIDIHLFILHGYITNSQYDQLPVGLIAQLVEYCTGIAEVMGSNPVQA